MSTLDSKTKRLVFGVFAATFALGAQAAASDGDMSTAQQRYKQERAACLDGSSHQDRATCLKEATNALAEARKNPTSSTSRADRRSNALARCDNVPEADKAACERLALGKGKESGSVEGGGVIKETVTRTVGPPIVIIPAQPK